MTVIVAVPLSDMAVRYHRPHLLKSHRAWCGVAAMTIVSTERGGELEDLRPCGVCWPSEEPPLPTGMALVWRQCRLWDAQGAWEGT